MRAAIALAGVAAAVALASALGLWQLDRAAQKTAVQQRLDARGAEPPLAAGALARTAAAVDAQQFRRAVVAGRWLADRTVYLDNRQMDGRVGLFVVTPLALDGGAGAVLVERGFLARDFVDRTKLPPFITAAGAVTVEGMVARTPSRTLALGGAEHGAIRQNLDIASFARESGLDLLPLAIVEQASPANAGDGLLRHWPRPTADVQKHYGYAVQWFAIAAAAAIVYVWHRFIRRGA